MSDKYDATPKQLDQYEKDNSNYYNLASGIVRSDGAKKIRRDNIRAAIRSAQSLDQLKEPLLAALSQIKE
jgi:hypothetical protein